jgi:hypothetical protein
MMKLQVKSSGTIAFFVGVEYESELTWLPLEWPLIGCQVQERVEEDVGVGGEYMKEREG